MKNSGTLYLIPTSLSKRPLVEELKESDLDIVRSLSYFIVETPKIARSYFKGLGIVIQELDMRVLDEHTKSNDIPFLIERLRQILHIDHVWDVAIVWLLASLMLFT